MSNDKTTPYVPWVLTTSAQTTRREDLAGATSEWSRDGEWHARARSSAIPGMAVPGLAIPGRGLPPVGILLQTVLELGPRVDDGQVVRAVTLPWFEIIKALDQDWELAFRMSARQWEEMVAGAYERGGADQVILTPRSGDHGRDVIATFRGIGTIRVIDQVKAYKPPHLVTADDVRSLLGVLEGDGASKGFLTTTSDFAPRLREDPLMKPFLGRRIELVTGSELLRRLKELGSQGNLMSDCRSTRTSRPTK